MSSGQVKTKIVWFAKGGGFAKCGPYESQVLAAKAMRTAPRYPNDRQLFPDDVFIWPEEVDALDDNEG